MKKAVLFLPNELGGVRSSLPIIEGQKFTIGRSHTASLDLPKFEVSRLHCVIEYNNNKWTICDKSSFGTTLNCKRIEKDKASELKDGDKINISVLKNSYIFCSDGDNCSNNCKDVPTEEITSAEDDKCKILQQSIKKTKNGMEELRSRQFELNKQFSLQLHGLQEKFQEQSKQQTPDQIKILKEQMEKEKTEIQEKYTKEVADMGKRLEDSQAEQENLRQQIDMLFEERGRDSEHLRDLVEDLDQLKREKDAMRDVNAGLEGRIKEMSETIEAEKENVKKKTLDNIGDIMESELQCCICNELFVKATSINCSHTFCENCLNSWLRNNNVCPMCRAVVTAKTRSLVIDTYIDKMTETLSDEIKERRRALLREREEAVKAAPPPPPVVQTMPHMIAITSTGEVQVIQNAVRPPNGGHAVHTGHVRVVRPIAPNLPAGVRPIRAPVIVRAHVIQTTRVAQHGRNVRPRLPHNPGAIIDLTGRSDAPRHTPTQNQARVRGRGSN